MLNLNIDDDVLTYFFQEHIRVRKFKVSGIFNSHIPDMDKLFVICDIRHIKRLNKWEYNQIAGYEIQINDYNQLNNTKYDIETVMENQIFEDGAMLRVQTIRQTQPMIFGWLDLLNMNIAVIIILILLVAGFNMISGLLILILERTNMIGILKSIGTNNLTLRKIFLYLSIEIVARGMIFGNILGIGICLLQSHFSIFSLDPSNYFLDTVPIYINPIHIILLNIGAIIAIFLMMLGPSYLAAKISPVKSINFD